MLIIRVLSLLFLLILTACAGLSPKTQPTHGVRCPAGAMNCSELLPLNFEPISIALPIDPNVHTGPVSEMILDTMELLGMPEAYSDRALKLLLIELTYSQFIEAYRNFPGGAELTEILLNRSKFSANDIKSSLEAWIQKTLPGYTLIWNKPDEDNVIEESRFFKMLHNRQIPIGDHHDLLVHLYLMTDPRIRGLTERIAAFHVKAQALENQTLTRIGNLLWTRLQEYTPVEYRNFKGERRLTVIGGSPSLVNPFSPVRNQLDGWNYLHGISELYFGLQFELNHGPAKQNVVAQRLFERTLRHIEKIIDIQPGQSTRDIFIEMDSVPNILSGYFSETGGATYSERWALFSKLVLEPEDASVLSVMDPEQHRSLMEMSIELAEILLKARMP